MRRILLSLVLGLSVVLSGCVVGAKQAKVPVPPPPKPAPTATASTPPAISENEPLSIPQTQVRLPKPQPINPEAVVAPPVVLPEPPAVLPAARPSRRAAAVIPIKPPETPEPAPPAAEPPRRIEPLLPADARKQLIEEVDKRLRQADEIVDRLAARPLRNDQRDRVDQIRSFSRQARQALDNGEAQQAAALSQRALLLAQELESAKQ